MAANLVNIALHRLHQPSASLKESLVRILRLLVFLFLTQAAPAQQPAPILPDPKLTPSDTFDVTALDVCIPGVLSCQHAGGLLLRIAASRLPTG